MIKAVILDFDDTLCLTEEACFGLENEVLRAIGATSQTRKIHKETWGQLLFEAIKVRSPGVDVEAFKKAMQSYQERWVTEKRLDHLPAERLKVLDSLLEMGKQLYVLTGRTQGELTHLLAPDHHLAKRIKAFYYRENMPFHKPDPRAFDVLLQDHAFSPQECVYIGDSLSDAAAAKQAKMHFIASLEGGLKTKHDFKDYAVDAFVDHLDELPRVITTLE